MPCAHTVLVWGCKYCMANLTAAAANRSAFTRSVEAPFDEAHWILDTGADFDMCPQDTFGIRTKRNDLGAIIIANGRAYTDHIIITNIDAIQDKAECVTVDGLTVRLLSVGRRCRKDGCRFCWSQSSAMANPLSPPSVTPQPTTTT